MVHWIFILVGFAVGFFFGACVIYWILAKVAATYSGVMNAVETGLKDARF